MTLLQFGFLFLAAVAAGGLNAAAGGGSFFTFPTLLFVGVPAISANATNTIALWPGVLASVGAYRRQLGKIKQHLLTFGLTSLIGGGAGALLLLNTQESTFSKMIPFLLLLATIIFATSDRLNVWLRERTGHTLADNLWVLLLVQLVIAVYGGFFGGGIGIMMLALLSVSGIDDINQMNALKLVLNAMINGVAVVIFIVNGVVNWPAALVMIVGAIMGGYGGGLLAQRVKQVWVRRFVVMVGSVLTIYFFYKYWL
jgi:hypothetical protein